MKKYFPLLPLLFPITVDAATNSWAGKIKNIRAESSYGFFTVDGTLPWQGQLDCSTARVWVDLSDEVGRVYYSTALAALAQQATVTIRASDNLSKKVYGACKVHDIVIHRN